MKGIHQRKNPVKTDAKREKINAIFEQMKFFSQYFDDTENLVQIMFDRSLGDSLAGEIKKAHPSLTECHVLQAIAESGPMNGTQLAKKLGMTRGGISRMGAKLRKKNLVLIETLEDNRKEVYYGLSKTGKAVADIHEALHTQVWERFAGVFAEYEISEIELIEKLFTKMITLFSAIRDDMRASGGLINSSSLFKTL
jgi:DNA-binding MarR family transcriptional regulator